MAIIDLRHLVQPECDIVKVKGEKDGNDYSLPAMKTIRSSLYAEDGMENLNKKKDAMSTSEYGLEVSFVHIAAWMRSYYPEIDIEWVKDNIVSEKVMSKLVNYVIKIFYPDTMENDMQESSVSQKKTRKKGKS